MSNKNAIVIDDTPANRDFLVRLMTQAGFNVHGAEDGKTAIETTTTLDSLALAVIDMELPDMNGLHLTQHIRQLYPHAYIVVATMHDQRSLIEKAFNKGSNCYLVKPHGFMELFKRLTTVDLAELTRQGYVVIDQYGPRTYNLATN